MELLKKKVFHNRWPSKDENRFLVPLTDLATAAALLLLLESYVFDHGSNTHFEYAFPTIVLVIQSPCSTEDLKAIENLAEGFTAAHPGTELHRWGIQNRGSKCKDILYLQWDSRARIVRRLPTASTCNVDFEVFASRSAQEDMTARYQSALLRNMARELECSVILWTDSATDIASKMLSMTAHGRGYAISVELGVLTELPGSNITLRYLTAPINLI